MSKLTIENIDPIVKKAWDLLDEFNEKTLIPMKNNLEIQWNELQQGVKIENYDISKSRYERFYNIYLSCKEALDDYISLLVLFYNIRIKIEKSKIKESVEKGRLLPSQITVTKSIINLMYELFDYYERKINENR